MITIQADIPKKLFSTDKIDALIKQLSKQIRSRFIQATPRDSGTAMRSYSIIKRNLGGLSFSGGAPGPVQRRAISYSFGNVTPYAGVLEKGSVRGRKPWPSPGPRTVLENGRIFSSQAPGGMMESGEIENYIKQALPQLIEKYLGK